LAVGEWDVDGMLERMPSPLLSEWMAFASLEPFGFEAGLFGHAITTAMIANVNRKKGAKAYKPQDFLPQERKKLTGDEVFPAIETWALLQGAKRTKRGNKPEPTR